MMVFIPISILAYTLNAGSILIDKILIKKSLPQPLIYTIYVSLLQLLAVMLIPFGFSLPEMAVILLAIFSGVISVAALYTLYSGLKFNQASVVGPVVGMLNPFFALLIEMVFLQKILNPTQLTAFSILIIGGLIITINTWFHKSHFNRSLLWLIISGFLFAASYVLINHAMTLDHNKFINSLVISRVAAGVFAGSFLLVPGIRSGLFSHQQSTAEPITSYKTQTLLFAGQAMGAAQGLLISFALSIQNATASLVHSVFGIQYLVIMATSLLLARKNPRLLDEELSKKVIIQKTIGALVISFGLYLLLKS